MEVSFRFVAWPFYPIGADWVEGCLGPTPTLENVIRRKICAHAGTGGWKAEVKSGSLTEVFLHPKSSVGL
jgi:hypothetical protein